MFKKNFIRLCTLKDESPTSVCKKIGITAAAFSQWNDNTIPRKITQQKIADYFGITVEELLSEDDTAISFNVNNGIIGNENKNNVVSVSIDSSSNIGEFEKEILHVCKKLDTKKKHALLTKAYELLNE